MAMVTDKSVNLQKRKISAKTGSKLTKLLHSDEKHMVWALAEAWRAKARDGQRWSVCRQHLRWKDFKRGSATVLTDTTKLYQHDTFVLGDMQ